MHPFDQIHKQLFFQQTKAFRDLHIYQTWINTIFLTDSHTVFDCIFRNQRYPRNIYRHLKNSAATFTPVFQHPADCLQNKDVDIIYQTIFFVTRNKIIRRYYHSLIVDFSDQGLGTFYQTCLQVYFRLQVNFEPSFRDLGQQPVRAFCFMIIIGGQIFIAKRFCRFHHRICLRYFFINIPAIIAP